MREWLFVLAPIAFVLFSDPPKPLHGICGLDSETFAMIERRKRPRDFNQAAKP